MEVKQMILSAKLGYTVGSQYPLMQFPRFAETRKRKF
jgi:hypothetical protein